MCIWVFFPSPVLFLSAYESHTRSGAQLQKSKPKNARGFDTKYGKQISSFLVLLRWMKANEWGGEMSPSPIHFTTGLLCCSRKLQLKDQYHVDILFLNFSLGRNQDCCKLVFSITIIERIEMKYKFIITFHDLFSVIIQRKERWH